MIVNGIRILFLVVLSNAVNISANICKSNCTQWSKTFISSGVNNLIVGAIEPSISVARCSILCSKSCLYESFYYSSALQACYCNTHLDVAVNKTTNDTGLTYGIRVNYNQDGSENFYRLWDDYVNGFGNRVGEYWLGLETMRIMTTEASTLRIELETFGDVKPISAVAEYSSFAIGSSASNYQLTASGFSGTCGDSLSPRHNGRPFSTADRDNDFYQINCAVEFKGAWWYKACHQSNLNGMYLGGVISSYADA